jgi:hypothetical protein
VAKLTPEQRELRLRLCAHLRRLFEEHHFATRQEMAERLHIDPGHFSALYNGKTDIGLDVAVQMHRAFGEALNALCDTDPPARFYPPGTHPGVFFGGDASQHPPRAAERPPPWAASPAPAHPGKHRHGGGGKR